jgi:hypothetical protein
MQSCVKKDRWMNINVSGDNILRVKDGTGKGKWVTVSFTTIMTILYKRVLT